MKVLKRYKTPLGFQYDVRSLHSWGLPRKGIPQDRLKVNPAGFSVLGSLEVFAARTKYNRAKDRNEIKNLKSTVAELKKSVAELKSEKKVALKQTDCLKKELAMNKETLRSLRPCRIFDGRRRGSEAAVNIREHVNMMIAIKEDELKAISREFDLLHEKFLSQRESLKECKGRLQRIERDYGKYIERQVDRDRELREAKSEISSLNEEIEAEKDDKDGLKEELSKLRKRCYYLSSVVENMKEQLNDALFDIENKEGTLTKEEVDNMIRRLFAGGLSIGDVQKVLDEVHRMHPGKAPVKGSSRGYLCQVRRDMRGVNRLIASIMVGNAESIQQLDFDDSNFDEVTITTTFLGLKMGGAKELISLYLDVCGIPEGKDAEAGAEYILGLFSEMQDELRGFREYLIREGKERLLVELPDPDEVTIAKASKGRCCSVSDNAAAAKLKCTLLMRKIFRVAHPAMSDDEFEALTDDEIRRRMRYFTLGCVVHERSLMLNEGSKREDQWLKSMCRGEFDSQDRVDMSLSSYLNAICKEFHKSYSKGAAGNGFLRAFHFSRFPDAPLMPLPTPGPGNRFCITSYLALCFVINFDVYVAYLYKVRAVGGGGAADDVKDGVLDKSIRLRAATVEFFACVIVRARLEWFLMQPLEWLQSMKESDKRILKAHEVPAHYRKVKAAMQRVKEDPDLAGHFEYRVITIEDYPSVGEMYERREQRRLKDPNGNDHLMGDLVREKLYRAFDPEVETLIKDRMREFADAIVVSIDRNADMDSATVQMLEEEENPEEFDYNHHDIVETCESSFGEAKHKRQKLQNALTYTIGGVATYNRNAGDSLLTVSGELKGEIPKYIATTRDALYDEEAVDTRRQEEELERKLQAAEDKAAANMEKSYVQAYKYFALQRLSSKEEMDAALLVRKPSTKRGNVAKHQTEFLLSQYKSYCYGCGYKYRKVTEKGNPEIGSLQDLYGRLVEIFTDVEEGRFICPQRPSLASAADEVIEAERIEGMTTLSHIRGLAANQFMGPKADEVARMELLTSCLPDVKIPWESVEPFDWSVDPPDEVTFYRPGEAFYDVDDDVYIIFRGFYYDNVNENYQFYLHEAVNEDELRKMLADHDEVKRSTDDRVLEAWHYDTNNERGVVKGVQQWNLEHRGSRGDCF